MTIRAALTKRAGSVEQVTSHVVRQIIERGRLVTFDFVRAIRRR
jgi:hypothetical protein